MYTTEQVMNSRSLRELAKENHRMGRHCDTEWAKGYHLGRGDAQNLAADMLAKAEARIEELEAEKKRLFDAHSVEMVRADALKQEVERLREMNIEMQEFLFPNDDCPEWMKEWLDDDE